MTLSIFKMAAKKQIPEKVLMTTGVFLPTKAHSYSCLLIHLVQKDHWQIDKLELQKMLGRFFERLSV